MNNMAEDNKQSILVTNVSELVGNEITLNFDVFQGTEKLTSMEVHGTPEEIKQLAIDIATKYFSLLELAKNPEVVPQVNEEIVLTI